jgi:hypothetical protein
MLFRDHVHDFLSVAIARTFGLCCDFGVIVGVVPSPSFAFDRNARPGENADAELAPTPSGLVLRRIF